MTYTPLTEPGLTDGRDRAQGGADGPPAQEVTVRVPQTDISVAVGRHPTANTIEALRTAIDHSHKVLASITTDLAVIVGEGLRPPASLGAHRAYWLTRMRVYTDRYYTALNHGIATAMGKAVADIRPEDLP